MSFFRKGKGETKPKESQKGRFPTAEEFRKLGQEIWNARQVMRTDPHAKFAHLAVAMMEVRPWNQDFDSYTPEQLKVLEELYETELRAIREALIRKVPI